MKLVNYSRTSSREGHSIMTKQPITFLKSDPPRVQVCCKSRTCPWYIWEAKSQDGYAVEIKNCWSEHDGCILQFESRFANYKFIARKYIGQFIGNPNWETDSIIQTVQEDLHLQIGPDKASRVRRYGV